MTQEAQWQVLNYASNIVSFYVIAKRFGNYEMLEKLHEKLSPIIEECSMMVFENIDSSLLSEINTGIDDMKEVFNTKNFESTD